MAEALGAARGGTNGLEKEFISQRIGLQWRLGTETEDAQGPSHPCLVMGTSGFFLTPKSQDLQDGLEVGWGSGHWLSLFFLQQH